MNNEVGICYRVTSVSKSSTATQNYAMSRVTRTDNVGAALYFGPSCPMCGLVRCGRLTAIGPRRKGVTMHAFSWWW